MQVRRQAASLNLSRLPKVTLLVHKPARRWFSLEHPVLFSDGE
jgi:hypothetical protein